MYRTIILEFAKTDIRNASLWYENNQKGLGKRFISKIREGVKLLKTNPYVFQIRYDNIRTAMVKSFPFMIHFTIDEISRTVIIVSVFHTSINPDDWKGRSINI